MWTGNGPRERRHAIVFDDQFREPPSMMVSISMWDMGPDTPARGDIMAENVTKRGFDLVFRTWSDTRVARIRADWTAIGAVVSDDDWDVE
ncbi:H-type lectin domain-containing protein [Falsirhodobacter sp. alg1]|uniref:H-type lectin domain-containing protein n=1 Tax=Falsirhodobacter sp. alg1 TaxID=1472418 RepID=UPI00351C75A2